MKRQRKKDIIFFPRFLKAFGSRGNNNRRFPNIALSFPGSAVICSMQTSYPTSLCYPHPSSPVDPPSVFHQIRPSPFSTCRFYMMVPARDPVCVCVCVPQPKISFLLPIVAHKRMTSSCAPRMCGGSELSIAIILCVVIAIHKYKMKGMMMKNKTKKKERKKGKNTHKQYLSLSRVF